MSVHSDDIEPDAVDFPSIPRVGGLTKRPSLQGAARRTPRPPLESESDNDPDDLPRPTRKKPRAPSPPKSKSGSRFSRGRGRGGRGRGHGRPSAPVKRRGSSEFDLVDNDDIDSLDVRVPRKAPRKRLSRFSSRQAVTNYNESDGDSEENAAVGPTGSGNDSDELGKAENVRGRNPTKKRGRVDSSSGSVRNSRAPRASVPELGAGRGQKRRRDVDDGSKGKNEDRGGGDERGGSDSDEEARNDENEDDDDADSFGHAKKGDLDQSRTGFAEYSEDEFDDSLGSEGETLPRSSGPGARLTMRQRAMQGEDLGGELAKLSSPRLKKKKPPPDELTKDEAMDIRKQQKARLRHMVHEKRNKEKRAAMVDKVLRGVTSKRKKHALATEAHVAKVGSRLTKNEVRDDCVRYINNREGATISLPADVDVPLALAGARRVAAYPAKCERDPRTGKRILS